MAANKTGPYGARVSMACVNERPSIMEFPTISLSGEAPPHVQARVLAEYKANQEQINRLRGDHA